MRENDPAASSSSISCGPDANAAGGYALTMYLKLSKTPVDSNTPIHIMKLGHYLSVTAYRIPNDLKKANVQIMVKSSPTDQKTFTSEVDLNKYAFISINKNMDTVQVYINSKEENYDGNTSVLQQQTLGKFFFKI